MANLHSLSEYWANEKSVRKALLVNEVYVYDKLINVEDKEKVSQDMVD